MVLTAEGWRPQSTVSTPARARSQFESLGEVGIQDFFSDDLRRRIDAVNVDIRRLLANRQSFHESLDRQAAAPARDMDFDNTIGLPVPKLMRATLLKEELNVREKIDDLQPAIVEAIDRERNLTMEKCESERIRLRKALVKLGWHDVEVFAADPHKIQPGWIEANPSVCNLRMLADSLHSQITTNAAAVQNAEAAERVIAELERLKARALAVSG